MPGIFWTILTIIIFIILISIKQINQYQKGVKFTLGKYVGLMNPGWKLVFPIIQFYRNRFKSKSSRCAKSRSNY